MSVSQQKVPVKKKRKTQNKQDEDEEDNESGDPTSIYEPNILTKKGFSEGCERHHITRKDADLRIRCNELLLDAIQRVVDAALIHADGRGEKLLTLEHLKAVAPSAREFPNVLY